MKHKFKIGDLVKVIDCAQAYSSYEKKAIELKLTKWVKNKYVEDNVIGVIVALGSGSIGELLYGIRIGNYEYIVGEKGLELYQELPFKEGDRFITAFDRDPNLVIDKIDFETGKVKLKCNSNYEYTIEQVTRYFNTGTWKLIPEEAKLLTKEQLYNTKIDVSESEELSRLVQEKLFELGFKWASSGKTYKKLKDCGLMSIEDDYLKMFIERKSFEKSSKKQIYPEDLGINIKTNNNNLKTNNYATKEQNNGKSIKVCRPVATISTTKRKSGTGISGRRSKTTISLGHLSNKKVSTF